MRRHDREITDRQELIAVMKHCAVCRLALNDDNGYPYLLPLNFGLLEDGSTLQLVFHSALEGRKLELLQKDSRASFEMDGRHQLQYFPEKGYCTFAYESVIGRGHIAILNDESEKVAALDAIMEHYHPEGKAWYSPVAIPRTIVYALTVESLTGKRKQPK